MNVILQESGQKIQKNHIRFKVDTEVEMKTASPVFCVFVCVIVFLCQRNKLNMKLSLGIFFSIFPHP